MGPDDPPLNANRDLVATGLANLGGALLGAMPAGGGTSQTGVVRAAGGRTQAASFVTAAAALSTMLFLAPILGLLPQVSFSGPVDSVVTGQLCEELLAVLREALTNVGKHAHCSQVVVTIAAGDELRLIVADDGDGVGDIGPGGHGLRNIRQRAERLGGSMELGTSREGGTRLTWHVPLAAGVRIGQDGAVGVEPTHRCVAGLELKSRARRCTGR